MRARLMGAALAAVVVVLASGAARADASKDVLAAQELWRQAIIKKDRSAFEKVLHPALSFGHSSGLVETKAQAIEHVLKSDATWERVEFADTNVRLQGDTALVTGKVDYHQRGKRGKATLIKLVVLSVWVKGPTGWQMIARQATRPEVKS